MNRESSFSEISNEAYLKVQKERLFRAVTTIIFDHFEPPKVNPDSSITDIYGEPAIITEVMIGVQNARRPNVLTEQNIREVYMFYLPERIYEGEKFNEAAIISVYYCHQEFSHNLILETVASETSDEDDDIKGKYSIRGYNTQLREHDANTQDLVNMRNAIDAVKANFA